MKPLKSIIHCSSCGKIIGKMVDNTLISAEGETICIAGFFIGKMCENCYWRERLEYEKKQVCHCCGK
jgi:hypothetical protein